MYPGLNYVIAKNIVDMILSLSEICGRPGIISIENSGLPGDWKDVWDVISAVRKQRPDLARQVSVYLSSDAYLCQIKLCYDPCNVVLSDWIAGDALAELKPSTEDKAWLQVRTITIFP